jgi:hypothetical protein
MATLEFAYQEILRHGPDDTHYRLLTDEFISLDSFDEH